MGVGIGSTPTRVYRSPYEQNFAYLQLSPALLSNLMPPLRLVINVTTYQ